MEYKQLRVIDVSHSDLDGVSCGVLCKAAFPDDIVTIYNEEYDTIHGRLAEILFDDNFDILFITDISPRDENVISVLNKMSKKKIIRLIDHHDTSADRFIGMDWAKFTTGKQCGALAFYHTLVGEFKKDISKFFDFATLVNDYDLWIKASIMSDALNNLLSFYGKERFVQRSLAHDYESGAYIMTVEECQHASLYKQYVDREVFSLLQKAFIVHPDKDTTIVIVYSEHFASQLGEEARKWDAFRNCDAIAVIGMNKKMVSFRSIRPDFNVGLYAKRFGGGGNPKTAGLSFKDFKTLYFALNLIGD